MKALLEAEARLDEQSGSNVIALQERAAATRQLFKVRAAISKQNVADSASKKGI